MTEPIINGENRSSALDNWNWGRDLLAFAVTVVCAVVFKWTARDMIWGLWICSLIVGYSFLAWTIITSFSDLNGTFRSKLPGILFTLAFFTFHFGGLHYGTAAFFNIFFPVIPATNVLNIFRLLPILVCSYWPLILTTLIPRAFDFRNIGQNIVEDIFIKPYTNVARMGILIFVFVGLEITHLSKLAFFPVLAVYFVPGHVLLKVFRVVSKNRSKCQT